jgi:hypothetical protein
MACQTRVSIFDVRPLSVRSRARSCFAVSPESPVFWRLSGLLRLLSVGPASCTVVDGVGPSPDASPAVAPGAGRSACCAPPSGVQIVAPSTCAQPASAPDLPPLFSILDRNRFCVVWLSSSVFRRPPRISGRRLWCLLPAIVTERFRQGRLPRRPPEPPPAHRFGVVRVARPFTSIQYSVMFVRGNCVIHRGQKPASRG